jgi:hypothetical protein
VPRNITGTFERLFAAALAFAGLTRGEIVTVLVAWIAAKLASNWQRRRTEDNAPAHALLAMMAGTVSVTLGAIGGLTSYYALYGSLPPGFSPSCAAANF